MSPEKKQPNKISRLRFKPEWGVSSDDIEFLESFLEVIKAKGFDPAQLIYSGFNGRPIVDGQPLPRHEAIFAMNEAGWRQAIHEGESNPAHYAERWHKAGSIPCIGLYDKNQLAEVYSHGALQHPENLTATEKEWGKILLEGAQVEVPSVEEGYEPGIKAETYEDFIEERTDFTNVVPGELLSEMPSEHPVVEAVIHKDYPDGSPTDALVGVVFLEDPERKPSRRGGL